MLVQWMGVQTVCECVGKVCDVFVGCVEGAGMACVGRECVCVGRV